ncbi:MAG TPA: hypothetical protein VHR47_02355 [Bacillota bacterium]|nr:hypothetical protein [Bacillota bacterium]
MMFRSGDVILFRADTRPHIGDYREFFLRFLERDENGILMLGEIPPLWFIDDNRAVGPIIFDEDYPYHVNKIDYKRQLLWLEDLI